MTDRNPPARPQLQFGVFNQGVNITTVWHDERSGSQIDFSSFRRVIETAERGLFTAFFLGEGLRLREHLGEIHDLDITGRPDAQTQLAALAAITSRIGLVATQNATFNDPADLAYRLASLDLLSEGRVGWNVVTTNNAWTGENFRRGGYLPHEDRYRRAEDFVRAAKAIWASWEPGALADSPSADSWARPGAQRPVENEAGGSIRFSTSRTLPASPQGRPVVFQAGDSEEGRAFAAREADVIYSGHPELEDAKEFARDIRRRLEAGGRDRASLKIFPAQVFILAETDAEAQEKARVVRRQQVSPQTALRYLEPIWGKDLSDYDPDGPLPAEDPVHERTDGTRGALFKGKRTHEVAAQWRELAEQKKLSIRDFVIHQQTRRVSVGGYATVADKLVRYAESGAVDGFNVAPYLNPVGLDDIVNHLIPALQERGVYRTGYPGATLRENLGLPALQQDAETVSA